MKARRNRRPSLNRAPIRNAISIEVSNRQGLLRVSTAKLRAVAGRVLRAEGVQAASLGIALVNDHEIRLLHRQFLGLDSATDVLTFPLHEAGEALSGEIVISVETAMREGPLHQHGSEGEVFLYLIHGLLHLCGYEDRTAKGARIMGIRQQELHQELGLSHRRSG